jgi:hypothetical protein
MSTGYNSISLAMRTCTSILDGLALTAARDILADPAGSSATSRQLDMIAEVLQRYHLDEAADELLRWSEIRRPATSPQSVLSRG